MQIIINAISHVDIHIISYDEHHKQYECNHEDLVEISHHRIASSMFINFKIKKIISRKRWFVERCLGYPSFRS